MKTLNTSNLIEITYLLEMGNRITAVEIKPGAYGVTELFTTLEGEMVELDHKNFLIGSTMPVSMIPKTMEAISNQIWKDREAAQ